MIQLLADATLTVEGLFGLIVFIIVAGLIWGLLWWLVAYCALPEPFAKVARIILAVVAVLFLIGLLLDFAGHPVVAWKK